MLIVRPVWAQTIGQSVTEKLRPLPAALVEADCLRLVAGCGVLTLGLAVFFARSSLAGLIALLDEGFIALLDRHMPNWRHVRKHLNDLPLG